MGREERNETREEEGRTKRIPLGVMRIRTRVPKRKGYVRRFISDVGTRLMDAQQGGWSFVLKSQVEPSGSDVTKKETPDSRFSRISKQVRADGMPLVQYLMEIRKELYNEDQEAKDIVRREKEDSMRRGNDAYGQVGVEGRYIPQVPVD